MKEKTYLRLLQFGIVASLLFVFLVSKDLLFPYITSKQFAFNILMEMMLALWLVFILRFPKYRPKKNLIIYGLLAYFAAILMSLVISVDPNLSFWGDAERMLGFFHILHFFFFFLILISVFRSWQEFKVLLLASTMVATIVSLIGIFGENVFSTIGNTAYVSGYLIFNIFFLAILFFRENNNKRWLYLIPAALMFREFWLCRTSGAIIALFVSVLLVFFLIALFHDKKIVRRFALASFLAAVIVVIAIFSQQEKAWFQNSFLRNLTTQKITFQTRLISWKGAVKDFPNHPIFGTGFGNYAITFDRHFDSKFFDYTTSETYFDRAHNNLIDIASTTGSVGLITYLSIFVAVLFYLFKEMKSNGFRVGTSDLKHRRNLEVIIILALISAYFIQNLAIFDSYVTYIGLMITLGFIYMLVRDREEREGEIVETKKVYLEKKSTETVVLIALLLAAYLFAANFNIKPKRILEESIQAYSQIVNQKFDSGYRLFQEALEDHPLERDARVVVINSFISYWDSLTALDPKRAEEIVEFVVSVSKKNVDYNPYDSLMQMQLAQVLDTAARFYGNNNIEKANEYSAQAMQAIEYAIESSPGRAPVYLSKAQMLLTRGENEAALAAVNEAIELNVNYYEGYCRLAQFYMYLQQEESLRDALNSCVDLGGASSINSSSFLINAVSYFVDSSSTDDSELNKANLNRAISLALRLTVLYPEDAEVILNLAKLYLIAGENDLSADYLQKAYQINPQISEDWEAFLDFWLSEQE